MCLRADRRPVAPLRHGLMELDTDRTRFDRAETVQVHLAQVEQRTGVTLRGGQVEVVESSLVP